MSAPLGYSRRQIALHWIVGGLIAAQFLFGEAMGSAWRAVRKGEAFGFDPMVALHVALGAAVLALILWRLALRAVRGAPTPPAEEPLAMRRAARFAHAALYALAAALPITGAAAWFGGVVAAGEIHEALTTLLIVLVGLHVAAVAYHRFVLRTDVLARMLRPSA